MYKAYVHCTMTAIVDYAVCGQAGDQGVQNRPQVLWSLSAAWSWQVQNCPSTIWKAVAKGITNNWL